MIRNLTLLAVGLVGLGTLAACSPDSTDFKSEGEDFLEEDDGAVMTQTGHTFSDADCEKPDDTDEGTTYTCTAVDDEGDEWEFVVEITGERELTVVGGYSPKIATETIVESLGGVGTVDEACVQTIIDGYDPEEVKAAFLDAETSAESQALFEEIGAAVGTQCLS